MYSNSFSSKINLNTTYQAVAKGSIVKITRTDGGDFDYDTWDSWGNMASTGFKGL